MTPLEIFAVLMSVIGVALTIQRNILCWGFNIVACALYAYLFFEFKLYGETLLQGIFIIMNFYGLYHWWTDHQQSHEIKIISIARQLVILQLLLSAVLGLLLGLTLKYWTDAAVPLLDAQLAAVSLLATYWTSRRYIATWMLWVWIDIIYVGMFIYKDLLLTAGLYAGFVGLALFGWWQWKQIEYKQLQAS